VGARGRALSRTLPLAVLAGALGLACVATPEPRFVTGEGAGAKQGELQRIEFSGFQRAWVRPGASFAGYDEVWIRSSRIAYRDEPQRERGRKHGGASDSYALWDALYQRLDEATLEVFRQVLDSHGLRLATAPGPGVLEVRVGLMDLVVRWPLNEVDGQNPLYVDSLASVVLLVDLYDSERGEWIARIAEFDEIASGTLRPIEATAGTAIYEARRLMRSWALRLRALLEALRKTAPS